MSALPHYGSNLLRVRTSLTIPQPLHPPDEGSVVTQRSSGKAPAPLGEPGLRSEGAQCTPYQMFVFRL